MPVASLELKRKDDTDVVKGFNAVPFVGVNHAAPVGSSIGPLRRKGSACVSRKRTSWEQ
jgi:hypothetical protein